MAHRYGLILGLILATIAFELAAPDTGWSRFIAIVLQGTTLVAVFHAARTHVLLRRGAETVAILATVAGAITLIGEGNDAAPDAFRLITVVLVAAAPFAIAFGVAGNIREERSITFPTVAGVLCIYLLLGSLFASLDASVQDISGDPFFHQVSTASISDFLYFSYATLTTVGYGDLTAATDLGRSLAILEALMGQIYLVTVVSLIVGNLTPRRRRQT